MKGNDALAPGWAGDRGWFVLIGAQRSRTSSLLHVLRSHPGASLPRYEIAFFEDPSYARLGAHEFLAQFGRAPQDASLGFKRPEILGRPEAPGRLAHAMPDARLVATLREPVSRTVSAYFHYVQHGYLPMRPLNEGLRALLDGASWSRYRHAGEVLGFSRYAEGIERVHRSFSPASLLVVLDRDLDDEPEATLHRVFDHIGLAAADGLAVGTVETNTGRYATGSEMVLRRAASRLVIRRDRPSGLQWGQAGPVRRAAHRVVNAVADHLPRQPATRPTLAPDVRARLADHLEPDVRRLEALLGRTLPDWPAR